MKKLFFLISLVIFLSFVSADFTPQGDINLRGVYSIKNVTWITFLDGTNLSTATTGGLGGGSQWNIVGSKYLFNNSNILEVNETKLNATIDARGGGGSYVAGSNLTLTGNRFDWDSSWVDSLFVRFSELVSQVGNWSADKSNYYTKSIIDSFGNFSAWDKSYGDIVGTPTVLSNFTDDLGNRGYTHLSNFTDDLGDRGYTSLSNFSNNLGIGNWSADKGNYYTSSQTDTQISNANTSMKNYVDGTFITKANEGSLNVNSSDYWDGFDVVSDLNNMIKIMWANITDAYTHLSNFTDDLGDRGYTSNLNFTNDAGYYNISNFDINDYYPKSNPFNFLNVSVEELTSADDWINLNDSTGSVEIDFNDSKLSVIYYDVMSAQSVKGTIDGTIDLIQHPNGDYDEITLNITEEAGSPGLDIRFNFTNVNDFSAGVMRYYTNDINGDLPLVQMWDYDSGSWEDYPQMIDSLNFVTMTQPVFDSTDHIQNNTVQMRIYKSTNGNINNHYYIDWVAISFGYGVPAGEEVDPKSIHYDGTVPLTDNWNQGEFNLTNTNSWFLGKIDWSSIKNILFSDFNNRILLDWDNISNKDPSDFDNRVLSDWDNISNKDPTDFNYRILIKEANITDFGSYLTSESDPLWTANQSSYYTKTEVNNKLGPYFNDISNFTGTKTDTKICTWDEGNSEIVCDYTDQTGASGSTKKGDGIYLYNDTDTMYLNDTKLNQTIDLRDQDTNCSGDGSCTNIVYDSETTDWDKDTSNDITTLTEGSNITISGSGNSRTIAVNTTSLKNWLDTIYQAIGNYLTTSTSFGGDISGTYNNIQVNDNSHLHDWDNITNKPTNLDTDSTDDLTTSTNWGGDLSGVGSNPSVKDDSHTHSCANITGASSNLCTIVDTDTTYSAGSGLDLVGTTFSHEDTSSASDSDNSGLTFIQDVLIDGFGHVTSLLATAIPTASPSDGDTTHLSTADQIYDWVTGKGYYSDANFPYTSNLNFTNDAGYYNSSDFDINDYYLKSNPYGFYNSTTIPNYIQSSEESNLNVNSSNYWDELNSPSDINAGDINNDGTYRLQSWDNLTGIPHATPSNGDTTHFSLADEIYDWVTGLGYATTTYVNSLGNWSADKSDYWDTSTDLDTVISDDEIAESKIDFDTTCNSGNHLYINGNDLACEADQDTTYSASGTLLDLTGTTFSVNEGTLTNGKLCTYVTGTGIVCNSDDSDTTYSAGSGLDLVGTTFSHEDTSSASDSDNSGNTFIQDILLDNFGHVTSLVASAVDFSDYFTKAEILNLNYYNATDFDYNDYYLKSNPYGFYNSTTIPTYLQDVVEDTSPQLGGYLDTNGNNIGSTTDEIDNIYIQTNKRIYLGNGQEASIYYNGTNLIISG